MPDTGAPWNIPYVDDADLVRDFPTADEAQALAIAAGLTAAGGVKQVVEVRKTDTATISSSTYVTVSGLSVTITPTSTDSRILLAWTVPFNQNNTNRVAFMSIFRGGTNLANPDSPGNRIPALTAESMASLTAVERLTKAFTGVLLDSPATTSATTYNFSVSSQDATSVYINRSDSDTDAVSRARTVATLMAIEVAV